jgi:hypothetical protein
MNTPLTVCTLLAFGFGTLVMLGWLAAAAAPLAIHLWSRRKYRETPWAAVTFLMAAMRRSARRIQLQQWLLLAVRTLIIVLVVLAVAEPYAGMLAVGGVGGPAHKVLVIDGSYSMANRGDEASRFARAKQLAAQLVRDSSSGDAFTVIEMAQPARQLLGRDVVDRAAIVSQIESLVQTHAGGDLAATVTLIEEALDDVASGRASQRAKLERQEVYFLTDLQRASWQSAGERLKALSQRAAVVIVDLGSQAATNLAVTRLDTADAFVVAGGEMMIEAMLHEFGDQPRTGGVVELVVDGVPVAEQTLAAVPAAGEAAVRFSHRFRSPGEHTVAVRAAGDRLEIDNTRWLVVPVRDEVRALCVAGKAGAARYLASALDPDPGDDSPLVPVVVSEGDLAEIELAKFDCVFLCNVSQLTASEAERLTRYAAGGGGVVVFLGDRVRPDGYVVRGARSEERGDRISDSVDLLPARVGEVVSQPQFGLDPLEYRHPIAAPFRGRERAGLLTTPVGRHFRLELPSDRAGVEVAAALAGGDPFIVTAPLGRGRVVLVATDCSLASVDEVTGEPWTAWPTWPSFLPLVREMMAYAVGGERSGRQQAVGTALGGSRATSILRVTRPDGRTDFLQVSDAMAGGEWNYADTDVSGIYSVRGDAAGEPRAFAVNVDTAESDLARIELGDLPEGLLVRSTPTDAADVGTRQIVTRF